MNSLKICDFESGDAGIYKCYVSHRYPVSTPNGPASGIYAPEFVVRVKTGSIWVKGIEPKTQKLSIGTPEVLSQFLKVSSFLLFFSFFLLFSSFFFFFLPEKKKKKKVENFRYRSSLTEHTSTFT